MRGGTLLALALLALMPFSGCIFFPDHGLDEVFGSERVTSGFGRSYLRDVLEARVPGEPGSDQWENSLSWTTTTDLVIDKDHPGPQGGGGETHPLPEPEFPTIEVRFDEAERLSNFTARWEVSVRYEKVETGRTHATRAYSFDPPYAGEYEIHGYLEKDGRTVAQTRTPLNLQVVSAWTVDSSVFPLRVEGTPVPVNYDEMRDTFQLEVEGIRSSLTLETMFRGDYDPAQHGTDVDLGMHDPDDDAIQCIGAGGGGSRLPDPAAAEELIDGSLYKQGTYSIHVGSLRSDCSGETWYHNQGPVPYRLHVQLG